VYALNARPSEQLQILLTIILMRINVADMYICLCKGVTDRDIAQAVSDGAASFLQVQAALGVSTQCGKCSELARSVVAECLATPTHHPGFYEAGLRALSPLSA
jgi:bacterioferritin-associated ferredoxin